ncbi:glycosyltransferase family 4 protein [Leptospira sp. GIMC2001]|uniref:glycosyltransferase family 4 protein n=1 Tax=Leptospira sp. GIMC2001 TaxID=1513297 RepID=UPI00234A07F8|nr:glycosyltransferase family 4 protein [Leptospira sp. GIMC2001]WCL49577.1 glycosyltransferase family 4 protein [Leptospira sp. GIMC2001]
MSILLKTYKVVAVLPRYSEEIIGGAERLARDLLLLLPKHWDIKILTTCAKDYISWKNEYDQGISKDHNLEVHRFPVVRKRNIKKFNKISVKLFNIFPNQTYENEMNWIIEQGPYSPKLIEAIKDLEPETDVFLFSSYLYYPLVLGIPYAKDKVICLPMLHDEPPAFLKIYKNVMLPGNFYVFNSPEEKELFSRIFGFDPKNSATIGTVIDVPMQSKFPSEIFETKLDEESESRFKRLFKENYIFAIGRMDLGKGYPDLISHFNHWIENSEHKMKLIIAGSNPPEAIHQFSSDSIEFIGFVTEKEKNELMRNAKVLINPSQLESFSIVVMEAWAQSTPILVNGLSAVLVGHCRRSNGGLWYKDERSFCDALDYLLDNQDIATQMGIKGREYVEANFNSTTIQSKFLNLLGEFFQ